MAKKRNGGIAKNEIERQENNNNSEMAGITASVAASEA
jgi:hypothetical protein